LEAVCWTFLLTSFLLQKKQQHKSTVVHFIIGTVTQHHQHQLHLLFCSGCCIDINKRVFKTATKKIQSEQLIQVPHDGGFGEEQVDQRKKNYNLKCLHSATWKMTIFSNLQAGGG